MKKVEFIMKKPIQAIDNAENSWTLPMKDDTFMLFDISNTNTYYCIEAIKHLPGAIQYTVSEITKLAAFNRLKYRGSQEFVIAYLSKEQGEIIFKDSDC